MDDLREVKDYPDHVPDRTGEEFRALRERVVAGLKTGSVRPWWRPRLDLPRRIWVPVVAGVLTVGIVLSVAVLRDTAGSPEPAAPQQTQFLQEAAEQLEAEASGTMAIPTADQWRYQKVAEQWWDEFEGAMPVQEHEQWVRADYKLAAEYNEAGELTTSDNEGQGVADTDLFTDLTDLYAFLEDLPDDDPAAVLDQFYAIVDQHDLGVRIMASESDRAAARNEPWSRRGAAFDLIREVLFLAGPPPEVQAKLFRALDEIPGTYEAERTQDFTGTDVVVIAWKPPFENRPDYRWVQTVQVLLDANSYTYRGHRGVDYEAQTETNPDGIDLAVAVLSHGIVDQPGQRP